MKNPRSRSPFINLSRRLDWTVSIWPRFARYLYWNLYSYHDIDNKTDNRFDWLINPFHLIGIKIFNFNNWWQNKIGKLFCRHLVIANDDPYKDGVIEAMYSYLEEDNPSRWFWVNIIRKEDKSYYSSFRYRVVKIEVCFMFKNEAVMFKLGKM